MAGNRAVARLTAKYGETRINEERERNMSAVQVANSFELVGAGVAFKDEICDMIAETQLFADLEWKDVQGLAGYVQCYRVDAGAVVFNEGDAGTFMCLLVKGQVEVLKRDQDDNPHRMVVVTKGKTVGEMSIVDGEPRSATCVAMQESVLLLLTKDNFARIIHDKPGLAVQILAKLAKLMSQRLRGVSGQLVEYLDS